MDRETAKRMTLSARGRLCFSPTIKREPPPNYGPMMGGHNPRSTLRPGNPHETDAEAEIEADLFS